MKRSARKIQLPGRKFLDAFVNNKVNNKERFLIHTSPLLYHVGNAKALQAQERGTFLYKNKLLS